MKKIRITRWCAVARDAKVLVIDSSGYKVSTSLNSLVNESDAHCEIYFSVEEYTTNHDYNDMMIYDYIFVFADGTIRNSKGLFEWSRFIRKCVESDNGDETEMIVKQIRSMGGRDCIYFKKKNDKFIWKKDVIVK